MVKEMMPKTWSDYVFIVFSILLIFTAMRVQSVISNQNHILANQTEFRGTYDKILKIVSERGPVIAKMEAEIQELKSKESQSG